MEKITEFPALEDRRAYLEHALYAAMQQSSDAAAAGKPDAGIQQWLATVRAELRELRYALWILERQTNRIEIAGRTLVWIISLLFMILVVQSAILLYAGQ